MLNNIDCFHSVILVVSLVQGLSMSLDPAGLCIQQGIVMFKVSFIQ